MQYPDLAHDTGIGFESIIARAGDAPPPCPTHALVNSGPPLRISNDDEFRTLMAGVDLASLAQILVIANTGEVTVRMLRDWLLERVPESGLRRSVQIQILLRSPCSSDRRRYESIKRSAQAIRDFCAAWPQFNVEIRYYAAVCPLRAAIFAHVDKTYSGYLSFNDWRNGVPLSRRAAARLHALALAHADESDRMLGVFLTWFRHFWGNNKIHTLIFDFDDTLFSTIDARVLGWMRAIERALEQRALAPDELSEAFRAARNTLSADQLITELFLREQEPDRILRCLLKPPVSTKARAVIRKERHRARQRETLRLATPIANIIDDVAALSAQYQLVIVSAASERLIQAVLEKHGLTQLFSYVFGREQPARPWTALERKAQTFIRISTMLGIPLERMIFVGDSDADHRAARQVGLLFIENRFMASRYGRVSLIRGSEHAGRLFLSGDAAPGALSSLVRKIEAQLQ